MIFILSNPKPLSNLVICVPSFLLEILPFIMQSLQQPSVLVLGHSFVWRLDKFITDSSLSCVTPNFQLPLSPKVQFSGIGGRTVTKLQKFDLPVVNRFQPTVLILEIGSNDLCIPNCNSNDLATTIFHLIQRLHFDYHVDHIIVSQIMPRCSPPAVTPPYNTRVRQVNDNLYYLLKRAPFASLWYHFALLRLGNKVFLPDGVHLNQMGNHFLYHSYQKALFRYFSRRWRSHLKSKRLLRYRPTCSHRRRYK